MMASTSSENDCHCNGCERCDRWTIRSMLWMQGKSRNRRKRGRLCLCEQECEELFHFVNRSRPKKCRKKDELLFMSVDQSERMTVYKPYSTLVSLDEGTRRTSPSGVATPQRGHSEEKTETPVVEPEEKSVENDGTCYIDQLPQEILQLIFSHLPLSLLLLVVRYVCRKWEKLAMDRTLWRAVEHLRIKSMVMTTNEMKTLLTTIPKLKILEVVLRTDTEELLTELFRVSEHLEMLRLDCCTPSGNRMYIPPNTVKSILDSCPNLKSLTLTDTYFRSRCFYKSLAEKFRGFERINITCTTKSEMDFFVENLKKQVPGVEFQNVSMMGKADGKQIYWGSILGLVVRPNPTLPYHRQRATNEFPNYAF